MFWTELDQNLGEDDKFEAICNSEVYANKLEVILPGLYYLVSWQKYLEKEKI